MSLFGLSKAEAKFQAEQFQAEFRKLMEIRDSTTEQLLLKLESMKSPQSDHDFAIVRELQARLRIMKLVREFRAPNKNN